MSKPETKKEEVKKPECKDCVEAKAAYTKLANTYNKLSNRIEMIKALCDQNAI